MSHSIAWTTTLPALGSLHNFRLARVFNAIPFPDVQHAFKDWVALEFPESWQKVAKRRTGKTVDGTDRISVPVERLRA